MNNEPRSIKENIEIIFSLNKLKWQNQISEFFGVLKRLFLLIRKKVSQTPTSQHKRFRVLWFVLVFLFVTGLLVSWCGLIIQTPAWVWNLTPDPDISTAFTEINNLNDPASKKDEISLVEQLNQAVSLERKGEFEAALTQYQTVQKSESTTARDYANKAVTRIQNHLAYPLWQVVYNFNNVLIKTPTWLLGLFLFLIVIFIAYYSIPPRPGFEIGEFVISKFEDKDTDLALVVRQTLADTITSIQYTHQKAQGNLSLLSERLVVPGFALSGNYDNTLLSALVGLGDTAILQMTGISMAKVLNIGQFFSQRRQYVLVGNLYKINNQWHITTKMLDTRNKRLIRQWEIEETEIRELSVITLNERDFKDGEQFIEVIRKLSSALAYKILYEIVKDETSLITKSWIGFYHLTEGLKGMQKYFDDSLTDKSSDFAIAHLKFIVDKLDFGNQVAQFDLGLFFLLLGDISNAIVSFENVKESIKTDSETIFDNLFEDLVNSGKKRKRSIIANHMLSKFRKQIDEITQINFGGVWPRLAHAWRELDQDIPDYIKADDPVYKIVYKKKLRADLSLLFEDTDNLLYPSLRTLLGFPETIRPYEAIQKIFEILDGQNVEALNILQQSFSGKNELNKSAWQTIGYVLDIEHIHEMSQKLIDINRSLDGISRLKLLPEREEEILAVAQKITNFSDQVHSSRAIRFSIILTDSLKKRNWKEVDKYQEGLNLYVLEPDPSTSKWNLQKLLEGNNRPFLLNFYSFLQPKETANYVAFYELQNARSSPPDLETLYNLALSHYLEFTYAGYIKSLIYIDELRRILELGKQLLQGEARKDKLKSLYSCLCVNIYLRADHPRYLAFKQNAEDALVNLREKVESRLTDRLGPYDYDDGYFGDIRIEDDINQFIYHSSIDVRAAAFETLGLWHERKNNLDESRDLFQRALKLRPQASSYIYLAESYARSNNLPKALHWIAIAKRKMPKLAYIHYLEKLWQPDDYVI